MGPTVSVVIPAYNLGETIIPTLESALAQSFKDFEIIVVNDGSTDNTPQILERYRHHPKIRLIDHHRNLNLSAARNTGIRAAKGEYIALLDGDDLWAPTKLEKGLAFLKSQRDKNIICLHNYTIQSKDDGSTSPHLLTEMGSIQNHILTGQATGMGSNLMAHRDVFRTTGMFDKAMPPVEDWDWLLRHILAGHKIHILSECLSTYMFEAGKVRSRSNDFLVRLKDKHVRNIKAVLGPAARRTFMSGIYLHMGKNSFNQRQFSAAAKNLIKGVSVAPLRSGQVAGRILARRFRLLRSSIER